MTSKRKTQYTMQYTVHTVKQYISTLQGKVLPYNNTRLYVGCWHFGCFSEPIAFYFKEQYCYIHSEPPYMHNDYINNILKDSSHQITKYELEINQNQAKMP